MRNRAITVGICALLACVPFACAEAPQAADDSQDVTRATLRIAALILSGIGIRVLAWALKALALWRWTNLRPWWAVATAIISDLVAGMFGGLASPLLYAAANRPATELDWGLESAALAVYVLAGLPIVLALNMRHPNRRRLLLVTGVASVVACAVTVPLMIWLTTHAVGTMRNVPAEWIGTPPKG